MPAEDYHVTGPRFPTSSVADPTWQLISSANPVFRVYATHACLLVMKVLALGAYTGFLRLKKKVFVNGEDFPAAVGKFFPSHDQEIERVRRAHRNDLENILPYLIIGFLFVLSEPIPVVATNCFRLVTLTRILHTVFFVIHPLRQPTRTICFFATLFITLFMAIDCLVFYTCF